MSRLAFGGRRLPAGAASVQVAVDGYGHVSVVILDVELDLGCRSSRTRSSLPSCSTLIVRTVVRPPAVSFSTECPAAWSSRIAKAAWSSSRPLRRARTYGVGLVHVLAPGGCSDRCPRMSTTLHLLVGRRLPASHRSLSSALFALVELRFLVALRRQPSATNPYRSVAINRAGSLSTLPLLGARRVIELLPRASSGERYLDHPCMSRGRWRGR